MPINVQNNPLRKLVVPTKVPTRKVVFKIICNTPKQHNQKKKELSRWSFWKPELSKRTSNNNKTKRKHVNVLKDLFH